MARERRSQGGGFGSGYGSNYHVPRKIPRPPQRGWRNVRHYFGRLVEAGTARLLWTMPVIGGETLVDLDVQAWCASDSTIQPDSAIPYELVSYYVAHDWALEVNTGALQESVLQAEFTSLVPTLVADPNPGGNYPDVASNLQRQTVEVLDAQLRMLTSSAGNITTTEVAEVFDVVQNYAVDKWTWHLPGHRYFAENGILVAGVLLKTMSSQTDVGTAELDSEVNLGDFTAIFGDAVDYADLDADQQQAFELFYGGDTYIEADTLKSDDFRINGIAQARFKTPYPAYER